MSRLILLVALTQMACGPENCGLTCGFEDARPPTVQVSLADTLFDIDQGLQFVLSGSDNRSLRTIGWQVTGAATQDSLTVFTETTPSYSETFSIVDGLAAGPAVIVATATDGSGNEALPDTVAVRIR